MKRQLALVLLFTAIHMLLPTCLFFTIYIGWAGSSSPTSVLFPLSLGCWQWVLWSQVEESGAKFLACHVCSHQSQAQISSFHYSPMCVGGTWDFQPKLWPWNGPPTSNDLTHAKGQPHDKFVPQTNSVVTDPKHTNELTFYFNILSDKGFGVLLFIVSEEAFFEGLSTVSPSFGFSLLGGTLTIPVPPHPSSTVFCCPLLSWCQCW